jgi:hypothetical protein
MDAFSSFSIPFQLATVEAAKKMRSMLTEDGIVISNIISGVEGERAEILQAEIATYRKVFSSVEIFRVHSDLALDDSQNIMLFASNKPLPSVDYRAFSLNSPYKGAFDKGNALTDDFAPVDQYARKLEY